MVTRSETTADHFVVFGPRGSELVTLPAVPLVVGREAGVDCGLTLRSHDVSRRHCRVEPAPGGGHRIVDLSSTNGVWVNDRRVHEALLEPFDRVRIGDYDLVYVDAQTDAQKVAELMGRLDETAAFPLQRQARVRDELLSLVLSTAELGAQGDLPPVLASILETLHKLLACEALLLLLLDPGTGSPRLLQGRSVPRDLKLGIGVDACVPLVELALATDCVRLGTTPLCPDGSTLCFPFAHRPWVGAVERRSLGNELRGALLVGVGPGTPGLDEGTRGLLKSLTRQIALLLTTARLHQQATIDPLTGLHNRGSIEQTLTSEVRRAEQRGRPLGVVILDVDDFKAVNDTYGHDAGDDVLRGLGRLLSKSLREADVAGRWGGEEFLVVLTETNLEGARIVAEKAVRTIAATPLGGYGVTVSAGVAVCPTHGTTAAELVRHADESLYAAKGQGKNQVCIYSEGCAPRIEPRADPGRTQRIRPRASLKMPKALRAAPAKLWLLNEIRPPVPLRPGTVLSFGRSEACDVLLAYPTVSRLHAMLSVDADGRVRLEDASSNGTWLNEEPLQESPVTLACGDRLKIGPYTFELSDKRALDGHETHAGDVLAGSLNSVQACNVLKRLATPHCTGVFAVHGPGGVRGQVEVREGLPVRAHLGEKTGEDAILDLFRLTEGAFSFSRVAVEGAREIEPTFKMLLRCCDLTGENPGCPRTACRESPDGCS